MSSTYSPITILDPTIHPHITDHMSSTYSPIAILYTIHLRNTHHWPHVQYVQSYHYIYPTSTNYETHITDHMSSTYSPITILDPTTHLRNTQHWPHVQYVQSYHYIRSHHPLTKHTSLTTCPVRTVLSLYYIPHPLMKHTHQTTCPIVLLY